MRKIKSVLALSLVLFSTLFINTTQCYAATYNITSADFGGYDIDADHKVNQGNGEANREYIWNYLRNAGFSEEATAGIMGNMEAECSFDHTQLEDGSQDWATFRKKCLAQYRAKGDNSIVGMGLLQFTWYTEHINLLTYCQSKGKQWTDLETQLGYVALVLGGPDCTWWSVRGYYSSVDDFKNTKNVELATNAVCWGYERPSVQYAHFERRLNSANKAYQDFKGRELTPVVSTDGSNSSVDMSSSSNSSGVVASGVNRVTAEGDLVGMEGSGDTLSSKAESIPFAQREDMSVAQLTAIAKIQEDINLRHACSVFDTVRVSFVFIGLFLCMYAVLLLLAMMFDTVNVFFEFSLLSVLTFGRLKLIKDEDMLYKDKGYVTSKRISVTCIVILVVGFLFVSGSTMEFLGRALYWLSLKIA